MIKLFILSILGLIIALNSLQVIAEEYSSYSSPVLIFVSFSMPDKSLKEWMKQAELIHAPVVIRGLINHSFKETMQKMADLTKDNHGGVQLDPLLFRRFHIDQVPAVVVYKETNCFAHQSCLEEYDVVYGNVTLDFALEKIAAAGSSRSAIALEKKNILQKYQHE